MKILGEICRRGDAMERFYTNRKDDVQTRRELAFWKQGTHSPRSKVSPPDAKKNLDNMFGPTVVYVTKSPVKNGEGHSRRIPVIPAQLRVELQEQMDNRYIEAVFNGSVSDGLKEYGEKHPEKFALLHRARITKNGRTR